MSRHFWTLNAKLQFCTDNELLCCVISVVFPVVNDEPVCRMSVDPPTRNQSFYQFVVIAVPSNRRRDVFIAEFSDVSAGRFPCRHVPDRFEHTQNCVFRKAELPTELLEF